MIELRPHRARIFAYIAAFVIAATLIVVGLLLKMKSTGVFFQTADQVAMAVLGLVLAGLILLFTRPRLQVGPTGLSVRNLLGDKLIPWADIVGVSFPAGRRWARIDLPDDEYVPVLAIQAVDKRPRSGRHGHGAPGAEIAPARPADALSRVNRLDR